MVVEIFVLFGGVAFLVFGLAIPVSFWATVQGRRRSALLEGLVARGIESAESCGDEDADRAVSVRMNVYGHKCGVEAIKRLGQPVWRVRVEDAVAPFCEVSSAWRAPASHRQFTGERPDERGEAILGRARSHLNILSVSSDGVALLFELRRGRSVGPDAVVDVLGAVLGVVDPSAPTLGDPARRSMTGAPVALLSDATRRG